MFGIVSNIKKSVKIRYLYQKGSRSQSAGFSYIAKPFTILRIKTLS